MTPEDVERERTQRQRRTIPTSDLPGSYDEERLEDLWIQYLQEDRATPRRILTVLLPLGLANDVVTREMITSELLEKGEAQDETQAGIVLATISGELGRVPRDYLRQVVRYDKTRGYLKDNYRIEPQYRELVRQILAQLAGQVSG